jgi:hypothetical protein
LAVDHLFARQTGAGFGLVEAEGFLTQPVDDKITLLNGQKIGEGWGFGGGLWDSDTHGGVELRKRGGFMGAGTGCKT